MKNLKTIFTIVLFTICAINFGYSQGFIQVKGKAIDVTVSPQSGTAYVVGISKNIFKYNARDKRFTPFAKQSRDNIRLAAGNSEQIFVIKTDGVLKRSVGSTGWSNLQSFANDIATDATGYVWDIEKRSSEIQKYTTKWERPFSTVITNVHRLAPVSNGRRAWVVMKDKTIKYFNGSSWEKIPGSALDIAIDLYDNTVYVVGTSGRIFKWNRSSKNWKPLAGTRNDFINVAVQRGKIWGTTKNNNIYYYSNTKRNTTSNNSSGSINTVKSYAGTYRVTFTRFIDEKPIEIFGTMGIYVNGKSGATSISIKPKSNKKNRAFDVSKGSPVKLKNKRSRVKRSQFINKKYATGSDLGFDNTSYIRKYRDFDVDDNIKEIEFDLQFNIKQKTFLNGEKGGWERQKLKIKDVIFGNEYLFQHKSSGVVIGFKIEKL